ncbi:multicopper oxidase family protein [Chitiniphilus eburneus]|uniref:Copper oxidase n=1 Tax=Chitiniphilus eburneus TaxID=2571148 RepID=A0A4U0PX14_9NEIS|nr:copper oxidase [Chitiniphilus eburneus]TJZ73113.1 copper oxidase [Chitiniphilus eburneus]
MNRRHFLAGSAGALAGLALPAAAVAAGNAPSPRTSIAGQAGVTTLNGRSLGHRLRDGVKEFHLIAEPVRQEVAPGMVAQFWGYNGGSPGPTIEAVEGDRVRIFVTNRLPEHTTIHWHGILLPAGMDGVGGLTQPQIKPGETYVYEFTLTRSGTFMYHPHADEMVQMAQGMMGMFIVHPRRQALRAVDRDYLLMLASYKIDPGTLRPDASEMLDFNLWTFNSRTFPGIQNMVARTGERVRIRVANLTMTNHPIHLHGVHFKVTGTDGGWIPEAAQWPEVTADVAVGQIRVIEFVADAPGDWAFHCHKSHHTMGPMGHGLPNMLGVDQQAATRRIERLFPGQHYMAMGSEGMAEMQDMAAMGDMMPLPANTLPMMTGEGPFGAIEMGGMFTLLKVRDELAPGDYADPGWYRHPPGTVARPATGNDFDYLPR